MSAIDVRVSAALPRCIANLEIRIKYAKFSRLQLKAT